MTEIAMRGMLLLIILCSMVRADDIDRYRPYLLPKSDVAANNGTVKVTFLGTSTLLIDDGETQILIDGFLTRPSMAKTALGKIETNTKLVDDVLKRVKADRLKAIFVTHTHYDHALDCAYVAKVTKAKLHGSESTLNVGRGGELPEEQMTLFKAGREIRVGAFAVTVIASKHTAPIKGVNDDLGQTIDKPLKQPVSAKDYKEGGSFDFLIQRGNHSLLVKPSAAFIDGALDKYRCNVLFLGTAMLGKDQPMFQNALYEQTIAKLKPELVIPIHWDNFFLPLSDKLEPTGAPIDDVPAGFDFLLGRLKKDSIQFGLMQGYQSVLLFAK